jgi:phospholipase C
LPQRRLPAKCPDLPAGSRPDPRIKHVIVLMLENRSFDHLLGYSRIPGVDGVWDKQLSNRDRDGKEIFTSDDATPAGDLSDPGHDFPDVSKQLYFPSHDVSDWKSDPPMQGFVESYAEYVGPEKSGNVMKCFAPESVPVITALAKNFAVCNRWFSSLPGPTMPNRLFVHAGTSRGRLDVSAEQFDITPTVYEILDCANVPATIYSDGWTAAATFWKLMKHQDQFYGTMDDFYQDCADNNLPAYCFLEPRYASGLVNGVFRAQNDQHPDSDVTEGEQLIYRVYKTIRSNRKVWESSVLLLVWDEHGGIFDHVAPPPAIPPGDEIACDPPFGFDRLGVRVPAVIVSAYTDHAVLNHIYDHTSIGATARKLLTGHYQDDALGHRAKNANTFDTALNRKTPRLDHIEFAPRPVMTSYVKRPLNRLQIQHLQQTMLLDSKLPEAMQTKHRMATFRTLGNNSESNWASRIQAEEAEEYTRRVMTAVREMGDRFDPTVPGGAACGPSKKSK